MSCKQFEMTDYTGKNGIYFSMQPPTATEVGTPDMWPIRDTINVDFLQQHASIQELVQDIKVRVFGEVTNYDRTFAIEILESSTAIAGEDYEAFSSLQVVPANKHVTTFPINFIRSQRISEENVFLTLKLIETKDFTIPFEKNIPPIYQQGSDSVYLNIVTFNITDKLYQPKTWNDYIAGAFTYTKMNLLLKLTQLTFSDFDNSEAMPFGRFKNYILTLKYFLDANEAEGTPVYETDTRGNIIYQTDENGEYVLDENGNKQAVKVTLGKI